MPRWNIYADLARLLADDERSALFAALEQLVPDSGCIGPNRAGDEELWFMLAADTAEAARAAATDLVDRMLALADLPVAYAITVDPSAR